MTGPGPQGWGGAPRGRHDHHIHLLAAAAARRSVACGPDAIRDAEALAAALAAAPPDARGHVRGVGYHESVAGPLDRHALDRLAPGRAVRVQHGSGQLWMLSTAALADLRLAPGEPLPEGVERDGAGHPTGRLYRLDAWLRARLGPEQPPDLAALGRELAARGVTDVTDAGPDNGPEALALLAAARARGDLPQRIVLMGTLELGACEPPPGIAIGPCKIHLAGSALPRLDDAIEWIRAAHAQGRAVAVHAVTRVELVFALAALAAAGVRPGDRLEHVHVAPPACIERIARLGLVVCVQPRLAALRRLAWLRDVEPSERAWLAPVEALARAGVPLLVGSDAPYGPLLD